MTDSPHRGLRMFIGDGGAPERFAPIAEIEELRFDKEADDGDLDIFPAEVHGTVSIGPVGRYRIARWIGMSRLASMWTAIRGL